MWQTVPLVEHQPTAEQLADIELISEWWSQTSPNLYKSVAPFNRFSIFTQTLSKKNKS